ncbi:rhodanese-like domain-containing protein [Aliishimia ponticola]|nr:rhodanese-like domain-containing protein [Aliishimia ponticola]
MILRAALIALGLSTPVAAEEADLLGTMQDYADFAPYEARIILPQQLTQDIFDAVTFIDTRSEAQVAQGTIPGAHHMEWRTLFARVDELPQDRKVILFCNTGALSAQAGFGLRVAGMDNVLILQGGYHGWLQDAAYRP